MDDWQPIETAPEPFRVVLTQHEDDLYPVAAYRLPEGIWLRETEGPEDVYVPGNGRHGDLFRRPTHWMPLPESPKVSRG